MGELNGKFLICPDRCRLDNIDVVAVESELTIVVVGGKVFLEIVAVGLHVSPRIN